jgi:hypothetical protein
VATNDRGYEPGELEVNITQFVDLGQEKHGEESLAGLGPDDLQWHQMDWATAEVVYPDGHREWVHLVGPFEDEEDFYDHVMDWVEGGTP